MSNALSEQSIQEALILHWHPIPPPALRGVFVLFCAESGLEIFAAVNGEGGRQYDVAGRTVYALHEHTPFVHTFWGRPIGSVVCFQGTTYLVVGPDLADFPAPSECATALDMDPALRQAVHGMAARHELLAQRLQEMRGRLDEDGDTVRKAKACHVYLFEQDRGLAEEERAHNRLAQRLLDLRGSHRLRRIEGLGLCYEQELKCLALLEADAAESSDGEQERQAPLRKRRPVVLLAEERRQEARKKAATTRPPAV